MPGNTTELQKAQEEHWDNVLDPANLKKDTEPLASEDLEREIRFYDDPACRYIHKRMGDLNGKKVLELGCGLGVHTIMLARKGALVTAADISKSRLKAVADLVKREGLEKNVTAAQVKAESMNFPDNEFDFIYTKSVLIHTGKPEAYAECSRVLKPGGRGFFMEPLRFHPLVAIYRRTLAPDEWKDITEYYDFKQIKLFSEFFPNVRHKEFFFLNFLPFIFQFALRSPGMFRLASAVIEPVDRIFLALPLIKKMAWFSVVEVEKQ